MLRGKISVPPTVKCPGCAAVHARAALEGNLYICPGCNHYMSMPSRARIALLADEGTFRELDRDLVSVDPLGFADHKSYRVRLQEARRETGAREAVTSGFCRIGGHQAVLVVFDFAFLGGTMVPSWGKKLPMLLKRLRSAEFRS